jgi:hypothetical protein
MPSEDGRRKISAVVLGAMASRLDAFRSGVATAAEQLRGELADQLSAGTDRAAQISEELGPFAEGRIDPERFAALFGREEASDPKTLKALDAAAAVLDEFASAGTEPFDVIVPRGNDLRDAVRDALTSLGRVFGAARVVELARTKRYKVREHRQLLDGFPFRRWNPGERGLAPPLIVSVEAADLQASGLGEYLDGAIKLVIVVRGEGQPAPLATLITPGVFVAQTTRVEVLERMAASQYPGVALLLEEERPAEARFVHDPGAGASTWDRLVIESVPAEEPGTRVRRPPKGADALAHLMALANPRPTQPAAVAAVTNGDIEVAPAEAETSGAAAPADRLAAWLLQQSDLT